MTDTWKTTDETINSNMGCIETTYKRSILQQAYGINSNMGCIETPNKLFAPCARSGLIVIWDVLKHAQTIKLPNMAVINSNMGCIETAQKTPVLILGTGLIVIWDVLKRY